MLNKNELIVENLNCPRCNAEHVDINEWVTRPHKTHLCLHCGALFEGAVKGVSNPYPLNFTYTYINAKETCCVCKEPYGLVFNHPQYQNKWVHFICVNKSKGNDES